MSDRLVSVVVVAVVAVFIGNFVATIAIPGYEPDQTIGPVMGTLAGGAVALYAAKRSNGRNGRG